MAFQEVQTLLHSRQLDAASDAVDELLASLPVKQRVDPPLEYLKVQHHLRRQLKAFVPPASREPLERVAAMTAPSAGRTEQAIELLEALPSASPAQSLRLGDLLLNRGRVEEARQTYRRLELPPARQWELKMRLALCDWAQDRPFEALAGLEPLPNLPAPSYYRAALLRQMGRYEDAMKVLRQVEWSSDQAGLLAGRMRSQIGEMAPEAL
jgi:tetratricopeptide (TPR) repeat protein